MTKRIALVTGGMGGIGNAICRQLHQHNYRVIAAYHRAPEAAQLWLKEQQDAGFNFDIISVDVTNFESCQQMARTIQSDLGPVAVLVNNAGITRDHSCAKMTKEEWDVVINTDLNSIFYVTHALIQSMREQQYGRIINISSINGQKGQFGQVNYSAAKAGIHGFTKALALEVARNGITVNTISPGYVETDMIQAVQEDVRNGILAQIPMGRFAKPDEVARVVAFLAEAENSYITGANIAINGGHYML